MVLLILDLILFGLVHKIWFMPWITIVWVIIWWGPLVVKLTMWLANIWWEGVTGR